MAIHEAELFSIIYLIPHSILFSLKSNSRRKINPHVGISITACRFIQSLIIAYIMKILWNYILLLKIQIKCTNYTKFPRP